MFAVESISSVPSETVSCSARPLTPMAASKMAARNRQTLVRMVLFIVIHILSLLYFKIAEMRILSFSGNVMESLPLCASATTRTRESPMPKPLILSEVSAR